MVSFYNFIYFFVFYLFIYPYTGYTFMPWSIWNLLYIVLFSSLHMVGMSLSCWATVLEGQPLLMFLLFVMGCRERNFHQVAEYEIWNSNMKSYSLLYFDLNKGNVFIISSKWHLCFVRSKESSHNQKSSLFCHVW